VVDLFLHLLLGTPRGLNLRNLAWHGFLVDQEVSPELASALVVIIMSICPHIPPEATTRRPETLSNLQQESIS
jgi:hypothetical protein